MTKNLPSRARMYFPSAAQPHACAVQFTHVRCFLCPGHGRLLVTALVERTQKSSADRQLCFLWRMESAVRLAALRHDVAGLLARGPDCRRSGAIAQNMAGGERHGE